MNSQDEDVLLRSTALKNVQSILHARQRAEQELVRTKEALEEETRILELLNKTGAALNAKLDLESLAQALTDAATELSFAQFGAFFYSVNHGSQPAFSLYTLSGAPRSSFEKFGNPRATPLFGPTFRGEGVIRIANVRDDPRYGQMAPAHGMPEGHLPVSSYLAVPVIAQSGEVLGGLFFGHEKPGVFTERTERLIVGIAAQAAIAIDNARLYESAKRSAEERATLLAAEREARAEVERVSLMKDEFLATLSHELRTPLHAILGWSELLLARGDRTSNQQSGLEAIARNARSQAQLIDDLLDMQRIVSGKIRLDIQKVELAPVIEAALESARPSVEAKAITLRATLDQAGPVFGDAQRLQQVIWNLVTNAVKFTPQGGTIDVTLSCVDTQFEVMVRDSGIGIHPDFLPHLFDRFRQANSSSTRRYGGLGLGLSIVKQLVELHGGTVSAASPGEEQGATFTITLPAHQARRPSEPPAKPASPPPLTAARTPYVSLSNVLVLVVDDEPDARELVASVLGSAGARVLSADSADHALALVKADRPDVIVSDIGMPGRDGYALLRDVRELSASSGGRTPAIALTAFARSEDRTRAMLAGYQVHMAKPVELQELVATIHSLAANSAERKL